MAKFYPKRRSSRSSYKKSTSRKKSSEARLLQLATDIGKIERGLLNPESKISIAHSLGMTPPEKKPKRTLY